MNNFQNPKIKVISQKFGYLSESDLLFIFNKIKNIKNDIYKLSDLLTSKEGLLIGRLSLYTPNFYLVDDTGSIPTILTNINIELIDRIVLFYCYSLIFNDKPYLEIDCSKYLILDNNDRPSFALNFYQNTNEIFENINNDQSLTAKDNINLIGRVLAISPIVIFSKNNKKTKFSITKKQNQYIWIQDNQVHNNNNFDKIALVKLLIIGTNYIVYLLLKNSFLNFYHFLSVNNVYLFSKLKCYNHSLRQDFLYEKYLTFMNSNSNPKISELSPDICRDNVSDNNDNIITSFTTRIIESINSHLFIIENNIYLILHCNADIADSLAFNLPLFALRPRCLILINNAHKICLNDFIYCIVCCSNYANIKILEFSSEVENIHKDPLYLNTITLNDYFIDFHRFFDSYTISSIFIISLLLMMLYNDKSNHINKFMLCRVGKNGCIDGALIRFLQLEHQQQRFPDWNQKSEVITSFLQHQYHCLFSLPNPICLSEKHRIPSISVILQLPCIQKYTQQFSNSDNLSSYEYIYYKIKLTDFFRYMFVNFVYSSRSHGICIADNTGLIDVFLICPSKNIQNMILSDVSSYFNEKLEKLFVCNAFNLFFENSPTNRYNLYFIINSRDISPFFYENDLFSTSQSQKKTPIHFSVYGIFYVTHRPVIENDSVRLTGLFWPLSDLSHSFPIYIFLTSKAEISYPFIHSSTILSIRNSKDNSLEFKDSIHISNPEFIEIISQEDVRLNISIQIPHFQVHNIEEVLKCDISLLNSTLFNSYNMIVDNDIMNIDSSYKIKSDIAVMGVITKKQFCPTGKPSDICIIFTLNQLKNKQISINSISLYFFLNTDKVGVNETAPPQGLVIGTAVIFYHLHWKLLDNSFLILLADQNTDWQLIDYMEDPCISLLPNTSLLSSLLLYNNISVLDQLTYRIRVSIIRILSIRVLFKCKYCNLEILPDVSHDYCRNCEAKDNNLVDFNIECTFLINDGSGTAELSACNNNLYDLFGKENESITKNLIKKFVIENYYNQDDNLNRENMINSIFTPLFCKNFFVLYVTKIYNNTEKYYPKKFVLFKQTYLTMSQFPNLFYLKKVASFNILEEINGLLKDFE